MTAAGRLIRKLRFDLKLRQKLLISYLAIIVIPFVALGIFVSRKVSRIVEERTAYSAEQAFEQAASFLGYRLYNVVKVSRAFVVDTDVNAILLKDDNTYDLLNQRVDMDTLTYLFFSYQDGVNIERIRLYVRDHLEYATEHVNLFGMAEARDAAWYRYLEASGDSYVWCPSEYLTAEGEASQNTLTLARHIMDLTDLRRKIGVLRVDIRKSHVSTILANSSVLADSVTYVENRAGDLVAASNAELLPRIAGFMGRIREDYPPEGGLHPLYVDGKTALVAQRSLTTSDWRIIMVIPFAGIESQSRAVRNQVFLVITGIAGVAYLLAFLMTGPVTRRLSSVIAKMDEARRGSLEKLEVPPSGDEVGELAATYNTMIEEIVTLMTQKERAQRELKGAELKALQAQINPHFLYNTLDMIKWMARRNMAAEIEELLTTLSAFYRLSLSEGRETIPIRDELRHVRMYARIQNMRFRGAIDFQVQVPESVLDCSIPKVTLQPLVENSILHGINETADKRGTVRVTGERHDGRITLVVWDDGVGMGPERLATILDSGGAPGSGFGVRNIHDRFRLYYGDAYGLSFESIPGRGTTVRVRFPAAGASEKSP